MCAQPLVQATAPKTQLPKHTAGHACGTPVHQPPGIRLPAGTEVLAGSCMWLAGLAGLLLDQAKGLDGVALLGQLGR